MTTPPMYHDGMRHFQDQFGTRTLADRLENVTRSGTLSAAQQKLITRSAYFFLATTDAEGWPDCSYKGGEPGFVRVVDEHTLEFPSYDGNGMYLSMGNARSNPQVGLLFIDFERPHRLRVQGRASVSANDPLIDEWPGADLLVRVAVEDDEVLPIATSGASILTSTVRATGCVVVPREQEGMPEGAEVLVYLYDAEAAP